MTDERIKEEFERWTPSNQTIQEIDFIAAIDSPAWQCEAVGFYAGFRIAERLAKIEVLDGVLKRWGNMYCQDRESRETAVRSMIAELKEANR